jgi:hypothetical protein
MRLQDGWDLPRENLALATGSRCQWSSRGGSKIGQP